MKDFNDWSEWLNKKNEEFEEDSLRKSDSITLDKSIYNAGTHPMVGYEPGKKQAKDTHAEYDPKYSFQDNKELVRMHHQDHKIPIKNDAHLHSLTVAAAKRGGHSLAKWGML